MGGLDVNPNLFATQLINFGILILWLTLAVIALRQLRQHDFSELTHVVWVLLIVLVPVLGAAAFLISKPKARRLY